MDKYSFEDYKEFTPDLSPKQVLLRGAFGGGYFRPIYSKITNKNLSDCHKKYSWSKEIPENFLTNKIYDPKINAYNCICGTSLEFWESKNWIRSSAPRGWFHWYCNFFEGIRSEDDLRQIKRWKKIVRFINQGRNSSRSKKGFTDKIKQTLLHWAYDPEKYINRTK